MSLDAQDPYAPPRADGYAQKPVMLLRWHVTSKKQSGLGIASFVIACVAGVSAFSLVVVAGVMETSTPGSVDETASVAMIIGFGLFAGVVVNFIGIALGCAALCQANRARTFAVLGLVFNALAILGFVGLVVLGLAVQA